MNMEHGTRSALVTGCSSGIGKATALRLLDAGYRVWATARDIGTLQALAAAGCHIATLDVCDEDSMQAVVTAIIAAHGRVDALVNNAGYGLHGSVEQTPLADVRQQFEVNVFGALRLCQLVLPGMRAAGAGRIVNVSSMGGVLSFPGGAAYHGSKFALEAISDVLRWETAGFGIGVTVIQPGPTLSEFGGNALRSMQPPADVVQDDPYAALSASIRDALQATFSGAGLDGAATPDEVAAAIVDALAADPAPTRVIVGAMAQQLVAMRRSSDDQAWDALLDTMYRRPRGGSGT
jgi:NAD(P)-dependent dehydrogenase (short-subunit alcohol dehydrogenase family)